MQQLTDNYTMTNGLEIPLVGFGTWQIPDGPEAVEAVKRALEVGYRHIDTAAAYGNERSVGQAIRESNIPRDEIFVTSKLWNPDRGYEKTLKAFQKTLSQLQVDYLDLYLIHWPATENKDPDWQETNLSTWQALEELYEQGKIRAIGVSNFLRHHLEPLLEKAKIKPMVNQLELHIGYRQLTTVQYCRDQGMVLEAWSPLGTGRLLTAQPILEMAEKYQVSPARICLRWCLQNQLLPLSKSTTPARIQENTQLFDFEISAKDMETLNAIGNKLGFSGSHPDEVDF